MTDLGRYFRHGAKLLGFDTDDSWPYPSAPIIGLATLIENAASVSFAWPASNGSDAIRYFTATSSPGGLTAIGSGSPLLVEGLSDGVTYTFTVRATSAVGNSPESDASNSVTPAGAGGTTWDAAAKTSLITLSNGDLTASITDDANYGNVRGIGTKSTGKRAFKAVFAMPGAAADGEVAVGLADATWDYADPANIMGGGAVGAYGFCSEGKAYFPIGQVVDLSRPIANGEYALCKVDFDAGKIWFGSEAAGWSGDPEAGTGEAITFTPNTPLYLGGTLYTSAMPSPASVTLDLTYSNGTFAAWDS